MTEQVVRTGLEDVENWSIEDLIKGEEELEMAFEQAKRIENAAKVTADQALAKYEHERDAYRAAKELTRERVKDLNIVRAEIRATFPDLSPGGKPS